VTSLNFRCYGRSVAAHPPASSAPDQPAPLESASARERLAQAAFTQFAIHGFDATTVDQIADAAGFSRRTFFRYFATKEDVIFPAHDRLRSSVAAELDRRRDEPPLDAVCASVGLVLADYVANREVSLLRFGLTRKVTSLRDREVTSVHRYERLFARYISEQTAEADPLGAELMASAVVAAHNSVLRDWLVNGGVSDPRHDLLAALARVRALFAAPSDATSDAAVASTRSVVAVFSVDAPVADVIEAIRARRIAP
jgi:AcrR family transcriptional regulator